MDNRPIGVFDSGVGGLSVVKAIFKLLPNEKILYFGDTKRAPYGVRPTAQIVEFSLQIARFLAENKCKALVIACNTICCYSLDALIKEFDIPIIEVITPSVNEAVKVSKTGVGLFATNATVKSGIHKAEIQKIAPNLPVYGVGCSLFVDIVEQGFADTNIAYEATIEYFKELKSKNIDTLILGCTHFPLMKAQIKRAVGENIHIIDPAVGATELLREALAEKSLLASDSSLPEHLFCYSGDTETFTTILKTVLEKDYPIKQVSVENY